MTEDPIEAVGDSHLGAGAAGQREVGLGCPQTAEMDQLVEVVAYQTEEAVDSKVVVARQGEVGVEPQIEGVVDYKVEVDLLREAGLHCQEEAALDHQGEVEAGNSSGEAVGSAVEGEVDSTLEDVADLLAVVEALAVR